MSKKPTTKAHVLLHALASLSLVWSLTPARPALAEDGVESLPPAATVSTTTPDTATTSTSSQETETSTNAQTATPTATSSDTAQTTSTDPTQTTSADAAQTTSADSAQATSAATDQTASTQPQDNTNAEDPTKADEDKKAEDSDENALVPLAAGTPVAEVVARMSLEDKIAQMIVPSMRTWDKKNVQVLSDAPALAEALRKHPYGGVILFGANVSSVSQLGTLVNDLQANNWQADTNAHIPYLMFIDEEGGLVTRLTMGTRMTGSMAVGATGANAEANARATGTILGSEISAVGFTVNCAPTIDVNSNPANPVIGTRSFSDDPNLVARLGVQYIQGVREGGAIATAKHFPGHGDTGTDSHSSLPAVNKTLAELEACEFVPFQSAIENGVELIMTAHITLPQVDDEQVFADGTRGYYPATMSKKILTGILREQLGYQGVVITDALEMEALYKNQFVEGDRANKDVTYCANLAEKVINSGADMLLLPLDLINADRATFYDEYIAAIATKARADPALMARIDESVTRILTLKAAHGLEVGTPAPAVDIAAAQQIVGSEDHHATEMRIAREAVTLVKNDALTLPASTHGKKVVLLGRIDSDATAITHALTRLQEAGAIEQDAYINNLVSKKTSGSEDSKTRFTIDYYCGWDDKDDPIAHYTDELAAAVAEADLVVCLTGSTSMWAMTKDAPLYQCVMRAKTEVHEHGGKFVLLSNNLPYDAARYTDADAILCTYMNSGVGTDPTAQGETGTRGAYNANVVAGIEAIFDNLNPTGTLPVNIPVIVVAEDGSISYSKDEVLYERGHGLTYTYTFTEGMDGTHIIGTADALTFKNNARYDLLTNVLVDDVALDAKNYTTAIGSTYVTLTPAYLDTLKAGSHTLTTVHAYEGGEQRVSTNFNIKGKDEPAPTPTPQPSPSSKSNSGGGGSLPRTGDIVLPIALVAGIALVIVAIGVLLKRREK